MFDFYTHQVSTYLPLSTSIDSSVGKHFATSDGVAMAIRSYSIKPMKYVNMQCVSTFQHEREYLFCGYCSWQVYFEDKYFPKLNYFKDTMNGINLVDVHVFCRKFVRNWETLKDIKWKSKNDKIDDMFHYLMKSRKLKQKNCISYVEQLKTCIDDMKGVIFVIELNGFKQILFIFR